jgi:hypothetical protein
MLGGGEGECEGEAGLRFNFGVGVGSVQDAVARVLLLLLEDASFALACFLSGGDIFGLSTAGPSCEDERSTTIIVLERSKRE